MKVTLKTLKREVFHVDANAEDTVVDLKKKVGEDRGVEDYEGYRLIFQGKVLKDTMTLGGAGIKEEGFIVVMPPRKGGPKKKVEEKPVEKEQPGAEQKKGTSSEGVKGETKAEESKAEGAAASAQQRSSAAAASTEGGAGAGARGLLTGEEYEAAITRISDMGFPTDQVKQAMRAAFNNAERAVEYLFTGIPPTTNEGPSLAPAPGAQGSRNTGKSGPATNDGGNASTQADTNANADDANNSAPGTTPFNMFGAPSERRGTGGGQTGGGQGAGGGGDDMDAFRRAMQSNPALAANLLATLASNNPALLQQLGSNPEDLLNALNQGMPEGAEGGPNDLPAWAQAALQGGGTPPGVIRVSEEEQQALARLEELGQAMGVNKQSVLQSWLACDRNEMLAANYIADHSDELRETQDDYEDGQDNGGNQSQDQSQDQNPPQS